MADILQLVNSKADLRLTMKHTMLVLPYYDIIIMTDKCLYLLFGDLMDAVTVAGCVQDLDSV